MNTLKRAARHVGTTAGPAEQTVQKSAYAKHDRKSNAKSLEQAADVALLLTFCPLKVAERFSFSLLLERRLREAYGGQGNG